ncbi:DBH-like monooxygenase protein 2 homolog [Folsomia candida]|uniref:DBH-like monooxygenase protein 2 n=1 Tax=Folsomia candida TaxID=158441 RepID=A0A226D1W0_FOLCA|nr:DBH-like monooxygenase protein 2 homolog [Folsomia candida]OXA39575.1 DBH-like monooxygenase protein 2 [Folsomia candida]
MGFANFFIFATLVTSALSAVVPINGGKYILETRVTLTGILSVKITAETLGWIGWGISPRGTMMGSDMVMGGFNGATGEAYIGDRYASHPGLPELDREQNVELVSASENATHTVLEFTRAVDTGDIDQDLTVENEVQFIVWAIGDTDDLVYHGVGSRGSIQLNLMDG